MSTILLKRVTYIIVYTRMEIFLNFRLTRILSRYITQPLWDTLYVSIDYAIVQVTAAATCSGGSRDSGGSGGWRIVPGYPLMDGKLQPAIRLQPTGKSLWGVSDMAPCRAYQSAGIQTTSLTFLLEPHWTCPSFRPVIHRPRSGKRGGRGRQRRRSCKSKSFNTTRNFICARAHDKADAADKSTAAVQIIQRDKIIIHTIIYRMYHHCTGFMWHSVKWEN